MKSIEKIVSLITSGRFLSVMLMLFLLSLLTVGNFFIYGDQVSIAGVVTTGHANNNSSDDNDKSPISSEEEKSSSSKSISSNITEEYLHEHDLFLHLYTSLANLSGDYLDAHGFGDDHSCIHCPPPDGRLF